MESPSCHNDFPPRLGRPQQLNEVAIDLFCTGVIGHPGHVLKLGTEIPNKKRYNWSTKDLKILGSGVQLRMRKD